MLSKMAMLFDVKRLFLCFLLVFLVIIAASSVAAQSGSSQSYDPPTLVCPADFSLVLQIPGGNPEGVWLSSNEDNTVPGGVIGFNADVNLAADAEVVLIVWTGLGHPEENCALGGTSWLCGLAHQTDERYEIWLDGNLRHTTSDWGEHIWVYDADVNLGTVSAGNHSFHLEHADLDTDNIHSSVFFSVGVCASEEVPPPPPPDGDQGCTPGYWRQDHHLDDWTTLTPDMLYSAVFGVGSAIPLIDAVQINGGGFNALMRHSTAALLNAYSPFVDYPYSPSEVIQMTQDAFNTSDPEPTKDLFEAANELGCPLGNSPRVTTLSTVRTVPSFTDGRINRFDAAAPVVLFSFTSNGANGVVVYSPFRETLLIVSPEAIAAVSANPEVNTLLGANEERGVYFYRLTTGEFQLNARTAEGKTYTIIFTALGRNVGYISFEEWIR